ncbi:MAG: NHL repeat-containing protein [Bacteroidetes bacterium]|nr:NHL repeat-containing protein [Bacteroidota bacterium]MCW5897554.1 NHL repeat-containing protein [Bacteroidota bacterium]
MTRFRFSSLLLFALFVSCSAVQSQRSDKSILTGTRFDVDINGRIIVADGERNVLRQYSRERVFEKETGGTGWNEGQFDHPSGVWARNGIDVFVADYGNHRIQRFDRNLAFISSFSTRERSDPDERFGYPTDVAVSRLGDLFICDSENSRILKITGLSKVERTFGGFDAGKGRLRAPTQLEIGPDDNIYVRDGNRVVVFDNFGNFILNLGEGLFSTDVMIFADEAGIVILEGTKLYVFDRGNRFAFDMPLATLFSDATPEIRAFVISRGTLYFLTSQGIMTIPDPREMHFEK